jgi:thiamine-phosphate pyrophosphorylase
MNLYYLTQDLLHISHEQLAEDACKAGVSYLQLRMKNKTETERKSIALNVKEICQRYNVTFIINDYVELAKEISADGVHLGRTDMSPAQAREILGEDKIIGGTANNWKDILRLTEQKVTYIGLGPFSFTHTKEKLSPILGIKGYAEILAQMSEKNIEIPLVAIGGIKLANILELKTLGIKGIAISSAINLAENRIDTAKSFLASMI